MTSRGWKDHGRKVKRLWQDISAWIIYERCEYCGERFPCYFALSKKVGEPPYVSNVGAPVKVVQEYRRRVQIDRELGDQVAERLCSVECALKAGFRWCVVCHRDLRNEQTKGRYCSTECERNHIHLSMLRDLNEPGNWVEYANCQRCGAVFPAHVRLWANDKEGYFKLMPEKATRLQVEAVVGQDMAYRYCSVACATSTTRATKWCKACGSKLDAMGQASGYCSAKCQESHESLLAVERHFAAQREYMEWKKRTGHRTDIEAIVEAELKRLGVDYLFEETVDGYTCDFVLPRARVVIECDGEYWHSSDSSKALDAHRDEELSRKGWTVSRLKGADIKENVNKALQKAIKDKKLQSL